MIFYIILGLNGTYLYALCITLKTTVCTKVQYTRKAKYRLLPVKKTFNSL